MNNSFNNRSLAVASTEIGRELADHNGATFYVKGTCMYPAMRPGDVLTIQSRRASDVSVGDIAVCSRNNAYLTCHRVIERFERNGHAFIITRPDRGKGPDEPAFDENLLGVVINITRRGRPVPLRSAAYPLPVRLYYAIRAALAGMAYRLKLRLSSALGRLSGTVIYRLIARMLFFIFSPRMRFEVSVPLNAALGDGIYRRLDPDTFDTRIEWKGKLITRWTLMLYLDGRREPAARITYERDAGAHDTWCVAESYVDTLYRGAGLNDALAQKAGAIIERGSR